MALNPYSKWFSDDVVILDDSSVGMKLLSGDDFPNPIAFGIEEDEDMASILNPV